MKHISAEVILAAIFLALLFVLLNPWHIFMPTYVVMMIEAALLVVFAAFLIFIWRETGGDERDERHREFSDRLAFLVGAGILLAWVIVGEWRRNLNPWVLFALACMVVAKTAGFVYTRIRL
jgi:hypothetical protein